MATLTIRGLDDSTKARLRVRAAQHGRSMEAEARDILEHAVLPGEGETGMGTRIHALFMEATGGAGVELELPSRDEPARWADFGDETES
jgi:plasmid stability protein